MAHGERITRRTVLRGAGVAVALPWLNAMSPALARAQEEGESGKPPVRLAYFYVPNGVHMPAWRPTEPVAERAEAPTGRREHSLDELPPTMRSLEPVKDRVMVISGLAADHCNGNSAAHEPAGGGFLVGQRCKHSEEPEVGGISVDQLVDCKPPSTASPSASILAIVVIMATAAPTCRTFRGGAKRLPRPSNSILDKSTSGSSRTERRGVPTGAKVVVSLGWIPTRSKGAFLTS